jgi:hypothetical protein
MPVSCMRVSYHVLNPHQVRKMKLGVVLFTVRAKNLKSRARNGLSALYPSNGATIVSNMNYSFISALLLGYVVECHHNSVISIFSNLLKSTTEKTSSVHKLKPYLSFCTFEKLSLPYQRNRTA